MILNHLLFQAMEPDTENTFGCATLMSGEEVHQLRLALLSFSLIPLDKKLFLSQGISRQIFAYVVRHVPN